MHRSPAPRRQGRHVPGGWLSAPTTNAARAKAPGLVLDRDGTLIELVAYLHRPQDVRLLPGAAALIKIANGQGVPVAVATNQSGLSRQLYEWRDYRAVESEIDRRLADHEAWIDGVAACPFHPDFTPDWSEDHAFWRKPGAGMAKVLADALGLDLDRSRAIGDNVSDIESARAAGLAGAIHVATGHGASFRDAALAQATRSFPVVDAADLAEALKILVRVGCLEA